MDEIEACGVADALVAVVGGLKGPEAVEAAGAPRRPSGPSVGAGGGLCIVPPIGRSVEPAAWKDRRAGLIDQAPRAIPLGRQGDRLAAAILSVSPEGGAEGPLGALQAAVADLRGLTRLTPTFRFASGVRLDAPSRERVERLARRIASGALDGRALVFVGFGDARGSAARNLALSRRRAEAVLEAVSARAVPRRGGDGGPLMSARGHGEALPAACDDTALGRRLNRRVELWVR